MATLQILGEQYDQALQSGQAASALFNTLEDVRSEASVAYRLSVVNHQRSDHRQALQLASRARELFGSAGMRASETMAMLAESYAKQSLGESESADKLMNEALLAAQKVGDKKGEAAAFMSMANMYLSGLQELKPESGLAALQKAEAALREAGNADRMLADTLHMMTLAYLQLQELDAALRPAHEAHVLFQRAGDKSGEADVLRIIANIELEQLYVERENPDQNRKRSQTMVRLQASSLRNAEKAVTVARQSSGSSMLAMALHSLAQVFNACGRGDKGLEAAQEAERLFHEIQDLSREAHALIVAADSCAIAGDRQNAAAFVNRATAIFQELGDAAGEALAKSVLSAMAGMKVESARALEDQPSAAAADSVAAPPSVKAMDFSIAQNMARETAFQAIGAEDEIDLDSPLMDVGLDSLAAISFREQLMAMSGLKLPSSLVFDYPSLMTITQHLVEVSSDPSMRVLR
mmetsp:Transcript_16408/g.52651  ORF Transcript_16408/g.52651 Transcript_16408/m.52651 type:complete len:465 (+) Transcript_16408:584-1978(+)